MNFVASVPVAQKGASVSLAIHRAAFAEFRKSVLASLFPHLRRRTTPCYVSVGKLRLDARLQGGNEIRLLLRERNNEGQSNLCFLIDIRKVDLLPLQISTDPKVVEQEARLLRMFATGIADLATRGTLGHAV